MFPNVFGSGSYGSVLILPSWIYVDPDPVAMKSPKVKVLHFLPLQLTFLIEKGNI
jgi:hypothetical protein